MEKPQYIDWIVEETGIVIKDDIPLKCYKIDYKDDESILDDWALHIRRNYIEDTELKEDADDNAMTVEQYLHDYVIPQKGEELGATVRSADIRIAKYTTTVPTGKMVEDIYGMIV